MISTYLSCFFRCYHSRHIRSSEVLRLFIWPSLSIKDNWSSKILRRLQLFRLPFLYYVYSLPKSDKNLWKLRSNQLSYKCKSYLFFLFLINLWLELVQSPTLPYYTIARCRNFSSLMLTSYGYTYYKNIFVTLKFF